MIFDFVEWKQLFQNNPEEAKRRWKEVIDAAIAEAPPKRQENLRKLQERLDMVRVCYKDSPIAACNALSQMHLDKVQSAGGLVARLEEFSEFVKESIGSSNEDGHSPQAL